MGIKNEKIKLYKETTILSIGFIALAWILDSLLDSLIFHEDTVIGQIIAPNDHEIAVRLLFGLVFIAFGIYIKRGESALKVAVIKAENEKNKTNEIIEAIGDGIILQDTDYKIVYQNQIQIKIYGNRVGEYCYKAYEGIDHICEDCPIELSFKDGKIHKTERKIPTENGILYIELTGSPIRDSAGKIIGGVKVVRDIGKRKRMEEELRRVHDDLELRIQERTTELVKTNETLQAEITERKIAQDALQESEAKYRKLIDNIQDGVFIIQDTKFQFSNEAFAKLSGYTAEEIIGKDFRQLVVPEDLEMVASRYYRRQEGEGLPREYEFRMMHKDGSVKIVNMNVGIITYQDRVASMGTVKDITEKKKLESQLLRSQRMESIGTLASGIAHDINNVLAPIMLSQKLLRDRFTDEESKKLLSTIERSTHRGAELMKQVLSFTKGVDGERDILLVIQFISEIRQIAKETFPRNIEIKTDIPKDLWTISGDATQLHQVIMNLCVNARDAMSNGGILSISAENLIIDEDYARMNSEAKIGPHIVITISDTGTGISDKIMERIFEPFFTTKEHGKGTGLGLSTSLGIVRSHGGFINVYSEIGKGSVFKVYLPAITTLETIKVQEHQYKLPVGHGETILVVDDEDQICEITKKILEIHGYDVATANNGKEAISSYLLNREKIQLVLMDMMMPIMDGPASIRELYKINPEVKVIVTSGLTEKDNLAKVDNLNIQAFLSKPYTAEKLLKTIYEVMNRDI